MPASNALGCIWHVSWAKPDVTVCLLPSEITSARHVQPSKTRLSPEPCRKPHPKATYCGGKPIKRSERPLNASEAGQSIARAIRGSNPARSGFAIALPKISPQNKICVVARITGRRLMNEGRTKLSLVGENRLRIVGVCVFLRRILGTGLKAGARPLPALTKSEPNAIDRTTLLSSLNGRIG